jgi:phosphatidylethanolamine-binding protein (PEBP) family uncharacterized protein
MKSPITSANGLEHTFPCKNLSPECGDAFIIGKSLRHSARGTQTLPRCDSTLAIIVEDPDAPSLEPLMHAIVVANVAAARSAAGHAAGVYERIDSRRKH